MNFVCVGDCSRCPFRGNERRAPVKPKTTVTEQSVEDTPKYEVKRNIFGKEKVVMIEEN